VCKNIHNYFFPVKNTSTRMIIHRYHPDHKPKSGGNAGKLIHLPDSVENLLSIAGD